ncbi:MAG: sensor histidine kinase, partial [Microcystaceae cyanobacterium]
RIDRWQPGQVRLLLELVRSYELDQLIERTRHTQHSQVQEWVFHPTHYAAEGNFNPSGKTPSSYGQSIALKAFSLPLPQRQIGVFIENQQPLVQLSASRDRAFSDLTHELRTPLTAISLVAETLQRRLQNPERQWVERMLKETHRLMHLIQDWLEISQLHEDPNQHLCYQSLELRELIFSAWQSLEPLAQQKAVTLAYSGPDRLDLQADKARLTQVFLNLFDNGIKHSPAQSVLRVEVETVTENQQTAIQINIIDAGSGFSVSDLPYIFDRLYRGDRSRARQPQDTQISENARSHHGSGLGLSIVQQILQAHGGSISAQNHPQTGGAWLQLRLPLHQEKAEGFY